jgi:hypothetical protein
MLSRSPFPNVFLKSHEKKGNEMLSTRTTRPLKSIALALAVSALAVPMAQAKLVDGRSPDTRDAAMATHDSFYALDPAIARAIAAHQQSLTPSDGRSPDTRDAAMAAHDSFNGLDPWMARVIAAHQRSLTPSDGRSPDTIDAALQAHNPVATVVTPNGFAWGDFGIGVGVAIGSMLMLAGLAAGVLAVRQSQKTRPAATA